MVQQVDGIFHPIMLLGQPEQVLHSLSFSGKERQKHVLLRHGSGGVGAGVMIYNCRCRISALSLGLANGWDFDCSHWTDLNWRVSRSVLCARWLATIATVVSYSWTIANVALRMQPSSFSF